MEISKHYDHDYFKWQKSLGEFGGWANLSKFSEFIKETDSVLDFGCGGGFLLKNLNCKKKFGIEINIPALENAKKNGIEAYDNFDRIADGSIDIIISDNALEHTFHPLEELRKLYKKLRKGGKIIFVVPCESINYSYQPKDINNHLYSWSPMCLGNLFTEAGFNVIKSEKYIHKWPPNYQSIAKYGRPLFEITCRIYGHLERSWFQVRIIGQKI